MDTKEYIFSLKKFGKALKKYWLILIIAVVLGLLVDGVMIVKSGKKGTVNVSQPSGTNYFQQITYVGVEWGTEENQSAEDSIAQHKEIINSCKNLFLYDYILEEIDTQLKDQGFAELAPTDNITLECNTSNIFGVIIRSQSSEDRVSALSDIITKTIIAGGQNEFGLGECRVANLSKIYLAKKVNNAITRSNQTASEWLEETNNNSASVIQIASKKNIMILAGFIILGLVAVMIISVRDETVVSSDEVTALNDLDCLGLAGSDEYVDKIIVRRSNNKTINFVVSDKVSKNQLINSLVEDMKKNGAKANCVNVASNNYSGLINIKDDESVVLLIQENVDNRNEINEIVELVNKLEIPIVGYVWIK